MPRKDIHTKKWHEMVKAIKKKGGARNPEAVANARLGPKAFKKASRRKSNKTKHSKVKKLIKLSKAGKMKKKVRKKRR